MERLMRSLRVAVGVFAAIVMIGSAVPSARSNTAWKPLRQMTCADFLLIDDAAKPVIVYWAATRDQMGQPESAHVDVDDTDRMVPMLVEKCKETPRQSFWHKVRAESGQFRISPTSAMPGIHAPATAAADVGAR